MKLHTSTTAMAGLIVLLALSSCSEPRDTADRGAIDRTVDEAAIRSLLAANWAASSAHDAEGVAATYLPDGDAWIAGLPRGSGADEIRRLEEDFGGMPGFQSYDGTIDSIRFISVDSAIVEVTGTTTLDRAVSTRRPPSSWRGGTDIWRIAAWRVMTFDETLLNMLRE